MQRITDLTVSVLASIVAFLLSWPFWRDFEYFAESHVAWWIYFIIGFLLSVYVFYIFIGSLRILFVHDAAPSPSAATDDPYTTAASGNDKGTLS